MDRSAGVVLFAVVAAFIGIAYGAYLIQWILKLEEGSEKMKAIAKAIQEGANAYLNRQYTTVAYVATGLFVVLWAAGFWSDKFGILTAVGFLIGAVASASAGYVGMKIAVRANVRTAQAAHSGLNAALQVAFKGGAVTGLLLIGLGLFAVAAFYYVASAISGPGKAMHALLSLGFGGSLISVFLRVGGGIFTKAADVGADLVGKVEAGIPEDDPRNAATIADNVGDNVGDCAGMAADLFESYEVTLVASIILGVAAFRSIGANPALGLIFPVIARAIGVLASIVGVFAVRATDKDRTAMAPINRGFFTAGVLTVVGTFLVAQFYVHNLRVFWAVVAGLVLAQVVSRLTEYFTSTETAPVQEIAESTRTGPATTILSGISSGLESTVWAVVAIAATLGVAIGLGKGNIQFSLYLVALCGMGMLATTGVVVSEDSFGPVSDNAAGIAEMSGEFEGDAQKIMVSLDAVGNTTKAITKGFAIGSAVIAAVALFASFIETIGAQFSISAATLFTDIRTQINVADPKTFI